MRKCLASPSPCCYLASQGHTGRCNSRNWAPLCTRQHSHKGLGNREPGPSDSSCLQSKRQRSGQKTGHGIGHFPGSIPKEALPVHAYGSGEEVWNLRDLRPLSLGSDFITNCVASGKLLISSEPSTSVKWKSGQHS